MHVRYTARDGGDELRTLAVSNLRSLMNNGLRLFSARHDFAESWDQFLNPAITQDQAVPLPLTADRFPFVVRDKKISIVNILALVRWSSGVTPPSTPLRLGLLAPPNQPPTPPAAWTNLVMPGSLDSKKDSSLIKHLAEETLSSLTVWEPAMPFGQLAGSWYLHAADADIQALPAALQVSVTENGVTRIRINPERD